MLDTTCDIVDTEIGIQTMYITAYPDSQAIHLQICYFSTAFHDFYKLWVMHYLKYLCILLAAALDDQNKNCVFALPH